MRTRDPKTDPIEPVDSDIFNLSTNPKLQTGKISRLRIFLRTNCTRPLGLTCTTQGTPLTVTCFSAQKMGKSMKIRSQKNDFNLYKGHQGGHFGIFLDGDMSTPKKTQQSWTPGHRVKPARRGVFDNLLTQAFASDNRLDPLAPRNFWKNTDFNLHKKIRSKTIRCLFLMFLKDLRCRAPAPPKKDMSSQKSRKPSRANYHKSRQRKTQRVLYKNHLSELSD